MGMGRGTGGGGYCKVYAAPYALRRLQAAARERLSAHAPPATRYARTRTKTSGAMYAMLQCR